MIEATAWLNEWPINNMRLKSEEAEALAFIRAVQKDARASGRKDGMSARALLYKKVTA